MERLSYSSADEPPDTGAHLVCDTNTPELHALINIGTHDNPEQTAMMLGRGAIFDEAMRAPRTEVESMIAWKKLAEELRLAASAEKEARKQQGSPAA